MGIFGDTRREAMRRQCSAAAIAPQKSLILPQDKSRNTRCLRFAARLVGRVNVRDLRESQIEVKCFPRCRILCRRMRRAFPGSARMRCKRLNRRPNLRACTRFARAPPLKRFHRHGFSHRTMRFEAKKCRRLPPVCRNAPDSRRKRSLVRASFARRFAMRLKRFNGRRFLSRSDSAILIWPQAIQLDLAKKAPLSERLFVLSRTP
jgi:hypothetical protein